MLISSHRIEEIRIKAPWGHIAAKCWNSSECKPVLVVHGSADNAGSFDRLLPRLSNEFYYVCVDLPGHGFSSHLPAGIPLDFMTYVHQLQRVVRYFKWKTFILMGHSLGAQIVAVFAATFPKEVEKLILLDACAPGPVPMDVFLVRHLTEVRCLIDQEEKNEKRQIVCKTYDDALNFLINSRWSQVNTEAAKPLLNRCLVKTEEGYTFTNDPRVRSEIKPAICEEQHYDNVRRIKCPVLVIIAKNSEQSWFNKTPFIVKVLSILENSHFTSKVVEVPGNHCVHNNNPELVAEEIDRFLRSANQKSKY